MASESRSGSKESSPERRRFGRFGTRLPVASCREGLTKSGADRRPAVCRLQIQDFSLGGVRAESAVPLKLHEHLTLRLPPNGLRSPSELTGRVVHCKRQEDRYEVGIEFCQTRPEITSSPWYRITSLFSLASQFPPGSQMIGTLAES
jgi:hypothetical protein